MSATAIEWTDAVWNPVVGCDRVSPGCAHCYAKTVHDRRHQGFLNGKAVAVQYREPFEVVQLKPERLLEPLSWRRPRRVFVNSVSDLFHASVPDAFLDQVFAVMGLASHCTFQVLTKRADRMQAYVNGLSERCVVGVTLSPRTVLATAAIGMGLNPTKVFDGLALGGWPLPNVWLGVSVENQRLADERIPQLLHTPAAVRFISAEPLLESVDLSRFEKGTCWLCRGHGGDACDCADGWNDANPGIDWVIVGGESGPDARTTRLEWVEAVVEHCRAAGVPVFVKQLGSSWRGISFRVADGVNQRITDLKAGDPAEWPKSLRVRQWPAEARA